MLHVPREMSSEVVRAIQCEMVSFFFMYHSLLGFLFIILLKELRVLIRVFDVLWLFFYFDFCEFVSGKYQNKERPHNVREDLAYTFDSEQLYSMDS